MVDNQLTITQAKFSDKVSFERHGLLFRNELTYDEWASLGQALSTMGVAIQWWLGDWWNYGDKRYGEMYSQEIGPTMGKDYSTLANYRWVASKVEFSRRRENLSWSHHAEVANLEPEQQTEWLERAEIHRWKRKELREKLKEIDGPSYEETKSKSPAFHLSFSFRKDEVINLWIISCNELNLRSECRPLSKAMLDIANDCAEKLQYAEENDNWEFI